MVRPRTHLVLCVSENGASWHADVGFGARGIFEPIPFGPGPAREQSGWSFRIVEDDSEFVLQKLAGDEWVDLYGFLPKPAPFVDVELSNWWTSTHPRSLFVTGLIVGIRGDDGSSTLLSDWSELSLREETPAGTSVTPLEREAIPELLATRFSLPGFALDADQRLVRVAAEPGALARLTFRLTGFLNRRGIYMGRRSARAHVALYRRSRGRLGGHVPGWPRARIALVDHIGARTGTRRTTPLIYQADGDTIAVAASKAGQPGNPAWFHNLLAHPETTVQIGAEVRRVTARVTAGEERERLWRGFVDLYPGYEMYRKIAAGREIPIVMLAPRL